MMFQSNRIVGGLQCTAKVGADAQGQPIRSVASGYHINVDTRVFKDPATSPQADALMAEMLPHIVSPATPQYTFGPDTEQLQLWFASEAEALSISQSLQSLAAGAPKADTSS